MNGPSAMDAAIDDYSPNAKHTRNDLGESRRATCTTTKKLHKIEKEIVCNCETSLLFWHPFDPTPITMATMVSAQRKREIFTYGLTQAEVLLLSFGSAHRRRHGSVTFFN